MSSAAPQLEIGKPAPNFTLPSASGGSVTRSSYRARRHLALVFLPALDAAARGYLEALRARYADVRAADSELLAVVTGPADPIDLPFPLLVDADGRVARRFLPDGAPFGLFILDRYAALRAQWALAQPPLPPAQEIVEWLVALDQICVL